MPTFSVVEHYLDVLVDAVLDGLPVGENLLLVFVKPWKEGWWRGQDLNLRPLGYEPNELPDCSTPRHLH